MSDTSTERGTAVPGRILRQCRRVPASAYRCRHRYETTQSSGSIDYPRPARLCSRLSPDTWTWTAPRTGEAGPVEAGMRPMVRDAAPAQGSARPWGQEESDLVGCVVGKHRRDLRQSANQTTRKPEGTRTAVRDGDVVRQARLALGAQLAAVVEQQPRPSGASPANCPIAVALSRVSKPVVSRAASLLATL